MCLPRCVGRTSVMLYAAPGAPDRPCGRRGPSVSSERPALNSKNIAWLPTQLQRSFGSDGGYYLRSPMLKCGGYQALPFGSRASDPNAFREI